MSTNPLNASQRSTEARKLLSSIEKHIGKLIEDKPESFIVNSFEQSSHLHSPINSCNFMHPGLMNVFELESSIPRSSGERVSQMGSRVSEKINRMEQFYVAKIKQLELRITQLEEQTDDQTKHILKLQSIILSEQDTRARLISQLQLSKNLKLEFLQSTHLSTLQQFRTELQSKLCSQKLLRMGIEDQLSKLSDQNKYLKSSCKELSENYRRLLEADMSKIQEEMDKENIVGMRREIRSVKEKSRGLRRKSRVLENVIPEVEREMKAIRKKMREL